MKIRVRYFASLREALGSEQVVEVAAGSTVAALRQQLIAEDATHARVLAHTRAVRASLDQVMCDESTPLREGAEVAFFPPVTGG